MGNHKKIREIMLKMQNEKGAAIKPLVLVPIFFDWLRENYPSKMNIITAKNMAEVFSALCNEHYIMSKCGMIKGNEFFMAISRWKKYEIKRKAKERATLMLKEMGLISYRKKPNGMWDNDYIFYKISVVFLDCLRLKIKGENS